mgnify:CR=1 FL=1
MPNSVRIVPVNFADSAEITASSHVGALAPSNLKANFKSVVWRGAGTTETVTASLPKFQFITCVALVWNNLTVEATVRVRIYGSAGDLEPQYDSGVTLANSAEPFGDFSWGRDGLGEENFYQRSGSPAYSVMWIPPNIGGSRVVIDISDPQNLSGTIEVSKLVIGQYWSPEITADLGLQLSSEDLSKHYRTESGDLRTSLRPKSKSISFSLSALAPEEGEHLLAMLGAGGIARPVFVSMYPEHADANLERMYQLYGKLSKSTSLATTGFNVRQSRISIEEL